MLAKFTPPTNPNIIDRFRLFSLMDKSNKQPAVTWVSAPAGSGKTSFVISYINHIHKKPLWFQVDEGDRDIASFFYFLKRAVDKFTSSKSQLHPYSPEYHLGVRAFARKYFRDLFATIGEQQVLVFDNIHEAGEDSELYHILDCICEEIPENTQLFFISRYKIPQQLTRLYINQHVRNIDADNLKFTQDEVRDITASVTGNGADLTPTDFEQLFSQTNGWITGIILILKQLKFNQSENNKNNSFQVNIGDNYAYLFDYFANEIFSRLDEKCQHFLVKVIYLPQISVASAIKITGVDQSAIILEKLENDNYFLTRKISTDTTFEFHALFEEFLRDKSQQFLSVTEIRDLQHQAADISVKKGEFDVAITLYRQTESWEMLASLIISQAGQMEKQGRQTVVQLWISYLPTTQVNENAMILYWKGFSELYYNPFSAYESLKKAYYLFLSEKNDKWSYLAWTGISISLYLKHDNNRDSQYWLGEIETLRKLFPTYPSLDVQAHIAIEAFNLNLLGSPKTGAFDYWLTETEKIEITNPSAELSCIAGSRLAVYYAFYGIPDKLTAISQRVQQYSNSSEVRPVIRILALWTEITASWMSGKPVENDKLINKALELGQNFGILIVELWVLSAAIYSSLIYNKLENAENHLKLFMRRGEPKQRLFLSHYYYLLGWYEIARGNLSVGHEHIQYAVKSIEKLNTPLFEIMHKVALAKSYILLDNYENADKIVTELKVLSKNIKNTYYQKYIITMIVSWSALRQSNRTLAIAQLSECFKFGNDTNIISGGTWFKEMLSELCELALEEDIEVEYTQRLIRLYNLTPSNKPGLDQLWPYRVKVYTLSDFRILICDQTLPQKKKSSKKALNLIKAIIALGDRNLRPETLASVLWPDIEADAAINVLNTTLHRLRKLVGSNIVILQDGKISLNKNYIWVDVWQVEAQLNRLIKRKIDDEFLRIYFDILEIYSCQFLIEDVDSIISQSLRFRIQEKFNRQAIRVGSYFENKRLFFDATNLYNQLLERDDSVEDFYIGLMRCALDNGSAAEGMNVYHRCNRVLNNKFRVTPSKKIELLRSKLQEMEFGI